MYFRENTLRYYLALSAAAWIPALRAEPDKVVINEVHYHPASEDPGEEFVELYNRGSRPVSLGGWSFAAGIRFAFPPEAVLPPSGFLVVARDAERIRRRFGVEPAAGGFEGSLSDRGEKIALLDAAGKLVDELRYRDREPFPALADGFGPSLERIQPREPGGFPGNWAASRAPAGWFQVSRAGRPGPLAAARLLLFLDGSGEARIDDAEVLSSTSPQAPLHQEGFEGEAAGWRATGNHSRSRLEADRPHQGSRALRLIATGAGGSSAGNVEIDLGRPPAGAAIELRFWIQFLSGRSSLVARLSGTDFEIRVPMETAEPTPGRQNSVYSESLPPFIVGASHFPQRPSSLDEVSVSALICAPAFPLEAALECRTGSAAWSLPLRDDGRSGDGAAGDGIYGAALPPQAAGTLLLYRVRARDALGQEAFFPGPGSLTAERGIYVEPDLPPGEVAVSHLMLSTEALADLARSPRRPVAGIFVQEGEVYPQVSVRHRGQTSLLLAKKSWKIHFQKDRRLPPIHAGEPERRTVHLDGSWNDKSFLRNWLSFGLFQEAGQPHCQVQHVRIYLNGSYLGLFAGIEPVNEDYLRRNGLDPGATVLFKSRSPAQDASASGFDLRLGTEDSVLQLKEFLRGLLLRRGAELDRFISAHLEMEAFLQYQSILTLVNGGDHLSKNYYLCLDRRSGQWSLLPWDLDLTWGHAALSADDYEFANSIFLGVAVAGADWNGLIDAVLGRTLSFRPAYLEELRERLREDFTPERLIPLIGGMQERLRGEAELDRARWGSFGPPESWDFDRNADRLKSFVMDRRRHLEDQLESLQAGFLRGDVDRSQTVDFQDAVVLLAGLFLGGELPSCRDRADGNDDGAVDISDAIFIIRSLQVGDVRIPPPFPGPGSDPTADALACGSPEGGW